MVEERCEVGVRAASVVLQLNGSALLCHSWSQKDGFVRQRQRIRSMLSSCSGVWSAQHLEINQRGGEKGCRSVGGIGD